MRSTKNMSYKINDFGDIFWIETTPDMDNFIDNEADEFSKQYDHEYQDVARESYIEGYRDALIEVELIFEKRLNLPINSKKQKP